MKLRSLIPTATIVLLSVSATGALAGGLPDAHGADGRTFGGLVSEAGGKISDHATGGDSQIGGTIEGTATEKSGGRNLKGGRN